eukprot:2418239-Amphidinium_carterae.1
MDAEGALYEECCMMCQLAKFDDSQVLLGICAQHGSSESRLRCNTTDSSGNPKSWSLKDVEWACFSFRVTQKARSV